MGVLKLFTDDRADNVRSKFKLEAVNNGQGLLFINMEEGDDVYSGGWICLDKETALELANHIIKEMTNG